MNHTHHNWDFLCQCDVSEFSLTAERMAEALEEGFESIDDEDSESVYPGNLIDENAEREKNSTSPTSSSEWTGRVEKHKISRSPRELWKALYNSWIMKESLMLLKLALPMVSSVKKCGSVTLNDS